MSPRAPLTPGTVGPIRPVPSSIARPEYVGKARPARWTGSHVQTAETIEKMRIAGRLAAQATQLAGEYCKPGVTTDEIDKVVHEFLCDHGAYPSTLGYAGSGGAPPFPKSCCTSLNEVICHGIPDSTVMEDGDIINVDVTAYLNGVHGDTDATFCVGEVSDENRLLVERTHEAMMRGIRACAPGRPINVIGRVIESYAKRFGYGVVRDFTGHGIGESFHSGLYIPHYDNPALTTVMEPGMTFTIEPMITIGDYRHEIWADKWTVVTRDRSWTAQFEHTVVISDDGVEILTLP
jgi:methionyl aminopeptidase